MEQPIRVTYLTYGHLRNDAFMQSFFKLAKAPLKTAKAAYSLSRLVRAIETEAKAMNEGWQKLVNEYALKDEEGKNVPVEGNPGAVKLNPVTLPKFQEEAAVFHAIKFDAKGVKIAVEDIGGDALSAADLITLEDVILGE